MNERIKDVGLTRDEADELAHSRSNSRHRVAQCDFHTGRTIQVSRYICKLDCCITVLWTKAN